MPNTAPTEKKPRVVSPAMQALRDQHKANVAAFRRDAASAGTLKRIIEDLLPKLTSDDRAALMADIQNYAEVN